jgi:hypothetical protein
MFKKGNPTPERGRGNHRVQDGPVDPPKQKPITLVEIGVDKHLADKARPPQAGGPITDQRSEVSTGQRVKGTR